MHWFSRSPSTSSTTPISSITPTTPTTPTTAYSVALCPLAAVLVLPSSPTHPTMSALQLPPSASSSPRMQPQQQQQPSYQQQLPPPGHYQQQQLLQRPPPRCAEVCLDLLTAEAVHFFGSTQYGPAAPAALQAVGFRVGRQLAERYSRDKPRLGDTLEVIKFVCKDFWTAVFRKQVDNLKTNHRGIYVLQDNSFRWLLRLAPPGPLPDGTSRAEAAAAAAQPYLDLPCGLIRGALTQLGISCTVEGDARSLPSCSFTIKITG